ncbi:MAG: hypothetical protein R3F10_07080 [Lysobacteraceae bacterium]
MPQPPPCERRKTRQFPEDSGGKAIHTNDLRLETFDGFCQPSTQCRDVVLQRPRNRTNRDSGIQPHVIRMFARTEDQCVFRHALRAKKPPGANQMPQPAAKRVVQDTRRIAHDKEPARQKGTGLQTRLHGQIFRRFLACSTATGLQIVKKIVLAQSRFRLDSFCRAGSKAIIYAAP